MTSSALLRGAALVYAAGGLLFLFAPEEASAWLGAQAGAGRALTAQLLGGALLGMAVMNRLQRGARIGGIYGRPVVLMNLWFAVPACLVCVRAVFRTPEPGVVVAGVISGLFVVGFGLLLFTSPGGSGQPRG